MKQLITLTIYSVFLTLQLSGQSLEFVIQNQLNSTVNEFNLSAQDVSEWTITNNHLSKNSNVQHLYIRQQYQGIEIIGANASLHLMANKKNAAPLSFHNNFKQNAAANIAQANASAIPRLSPVEAVAAAAKQLGYRVNETIEITKTLDEVGNRVLLNKAGISLENIPAKLVYQADNKGNLKLAWDISILELNHANWWSIRVDAQSGEILDKNNWTLSCNFSTPDECAEEERHNHRHHVNIDKHTNTITSNSLSAGYNVYAVPVESPIHGSRTLVTDPSDATASPYGWHDDNGVMGAEYTYTRGNNVHAQEDRDGNNGTGYSPDGGASLNFNYPIDLALEPANNQDAMITNLFYWNNIIHDVAYHLGFDEASGNFQENNYGNGGFGSDYVYADAQDGVDIGNENNANFSTPPDGSNPRMQMYLWTSPTPDIDGDLDNGIILHEYGHGISIRLTGGASNSGCLNNTEQMGEGWSDFWGIMLSMKASDQGSDKRGVGTYALNQSTDGNGIRTYPYSTDLGINPHTYDDINGLAAPHGVGSVWCAMIWEMAWELINEHGFDENLYQGIGGGGNNIAMQLVLEGMKLQPCSPGFVDGRDAILKADTALYGGANSCLIWRAFAKRGLGYSADQGSTSSKTDGTEAFDLPPGVNENCVTTPDYAVIINPNRKSACAGSDFEYEVSILAFNGYTGTVTLSDDIFPTGTTSNLGATTFSTFPATTTWTISNTAGLTEGDYTLTINGTDGTIAHQKSATLEILPNADAPILTAPANNTTVTSLNQTLSWNSAIGAAHYELQIATDANFNNIILDVSNIAGTSYASGILSPNTAYFWRVRSNSCSTSAYNIFSFTTSSSCGGTFTDSGGANGSYSNNELQEWIFCPDSPSGLVTVNFTSFDLETFGTSNCWDDLTIYDGNSTSAPSLGSFCGTTPDDLPNGGFISATNGDGCLTFVFESDGSIVRSGWEATIGCTDCPSPVINAIETLPENCSNNNGSITVTTNSLSLIEYLLTPNGGAEIINTTGIFSGLSAGDYTISLRLQGDPDCASTPRGITLTSIDPTISEASIVNESCNGFSDGSVTITSNFDGPLDYLLTPTGGTTITNSTGIFSNLTAGIYSATVRATGTTSCVSQALAIDVNTTTITPPSVSNFELCTSASSMGEGMVATCDTEICNAYTIEPNSPINASNTTVCETIAVSGSGQTVSEIYLSFMVQHAWVGDLSATLESPDGTIISLFNAPGKPASGFGCSQNNLNLIFADTASLTATELNNTCNTSSSATTYAIEGAFQSIDLFSTLNGETANGDWKICFYDSYASLDHGTIENITLIVNPSISVASWWDAPTGGNMVFSGNTFNPITTNHLGQSQVGTHTFYAQCECVDCPSTRTAATFEIEDGSYYYLDNDMDGFGDANTSVFICSGETPPNNYINNFTDCDDSNNADVTMSINDHPVNVEMYQVNAMITSEGTVEPNVDLVTFQAGESITLMPGFHAMAGSNFLARIDNCGQASTAILGAANNSISRQSPTIPVNDIFDISLKVFPNPFINTTKIAFELPHDEKINLTVYDNFGRLIKTYYNGSRKSAGPHEVVFESENLIAGLYIVILRTEDTVMSQRIILTR